jgi:hypothetical protein
MTKRVVPLSYGYHIRLFRSTLIMAVLLLAFWPPAKSSGTSEWPAPTNISHSTYGAYGPAIAFDSQGFTHAVWWGDAEVSTDWSIWYANNRSGNWSSSKRIAVGNDLRAPKIEVGTADELHVLFEDRGNDEIMYIRSTNYGQSWTNKFNLSDSPAKAYEPDLGVDTEGNLHAVWIDNRWAGSSLYQVTYAKRTSGSWGAPTRVQSSVGFNKQPAVTTTGSGDQLLVHIVFHGKGSDDQPNYRNEIYYVRGDETVWEAPRNLSASPDHASYDADITSVEPEELYVTWDESPPNSYHDIYLQGSSDNGTTWTAPVPVVINPDLSRYPAIEFGQQELQIVYDDDSEGGGDVFYASYEPGTGQVSTPANLSRNAGESKEADVRVNPSRIAVSWMDKEPKWDIMYTTKRCGPIEQVTISGPAFVKTEETGLYTAAYSPTTATVPVSFVWDNGAVGSTAAYSWTQPGTHTLAVTATNPCGQQSSDPFTVEVCQPVKDIGVQGPVVISPGITATFSAIYFPTNTTAPVTFTWDNGAVTNTTVYSWSVAGRYTLTITATSYCGEVTKGVRIHVLTDTDVVVFLPLTAKGYKAR